MKLTNDIALILYALIALLPAVQAGDKGKQIGRTTEKEVNVVLSSSFGSVFISRGDPGKILIAESASSDPSPIVINYNVRNRIGYLEIDLGEQSTTEEDGHKSWGIHGGEWHLTFSDGIPLSFDVELGVGKGNFDLSGLQIKDFNLSAGASEVVMTFDEENPTSLDRMNIESGVSKFRGINLGNANFKEFSFEGGVGTTYLDFGGNLEREVDVDLNLGLGVLTLIVPEKVGARVSYQDSWMSSIECDKSFEAVSEGEYSTDNYSRAAGRMNIRLESGMGSITIVRQ
jgi:hypothetical protein